MPVKHRCKRLKFRLMWGQSVTKRDGGERNLKGVQNDILFGKSSHIFVRYKQNVKSIFDKE